MAAGAVAGCSAAGGSANAATSQLEQRTIIVDSVPVAEEGGLYVAQARGFFAGQGLTVKINSITGGERAIPDLQAGRAQLVAGNYVSFILAQLAGDIRQVIPAGGFPALLKMLPAGQVDAAWLPQPLGEIAEQHTGAVPITDFDQGSLQDFPFTGYIGSTQWVRSHPNAVAAFLRALDEGQQLADTDRQSVEQATEEYTDISPMVAAAMAIDSYPLEIDVPQLQGVADSMFEFGLTPGAKAPYQIAGMIQPEPGTISR
jgi:ABC-type nitrate/sulfonate/bicarbonate transport system substrate-binding protein